MKFCLVCLVTVDKLSGVVNVHSADDNENNSEKDETVEMKAVLKSPGDVTFIVHDQYGHRMSPHIEEDHQRGEQ